MGRFWARSERTLKRRTPSGRLFVSGEIFAADPSQEDGANSTTMNEVKG
jgi:hypothetical protein